MRHTTDLPSGHPNKPAILGLLVLVFVCGLAVLAVLVPVGPGFVPKGGGWFRPAVVGGAFTLHPLYMAVPWAACFVLGLLGGRPLAHAFMFAYLLYPFGYQLIQRGGGVQFSIWTYMPQVAIMARPVLAVALVLLAFSPMGRPEVRDTREHAALAAALLIGAQLLLGYWFYSYLTWCYPLLVIAIIRARSDRKAASIPALTPAHQAAAIRTAAALQQRY
jgi:hypothetical protein